MSVESGGGRRIDCDEEPFGCREGNNDQQNTIFMTCKDDYENINAILSLVTQMTTMASW